MTKQSDITALVEEAQAHVLALQAQGMALEEVRLLASLSKRRFAEVMSKDTPAARVGLFKACEAVLAQRYVDLGAVHLGRPMASSEAKRGRCFTEEKDPKIFLPPTAPTSDAFPTCWACPVRFECLSVSYHPIGNQGKVEVDPFVFGGMSEGGRKELLPFIQARQETRVEVAA